METKICAKCKIEQPVNNFGWRRPEKGQRQSYCKKCCNLDYKKWAEKTGRTKTEMYKKEQRDAYERKTESRDDREQLKFLLNGAKHRAMKKGLPFDLTVAGMWPVPIHCPVLGIPLKWNEKVPGPDSPSIDRIDNSKGYVKGNVMIISTRANSLKSDITREELMSVANHYLKLTDLLDEQDWIAASKENTSLSLEESIKWLKENVFISRAESFSEA